jgi:hypothetical protein
MLETDEIWEKQITAALSTEGKPLTEQRLQKISSVLQNSGRESWSRIPRIYTTLRLINELPLIDRFIKQGISDSWFPFVHQTLPVIDRPTARNNFIKTQSLVLTKGLYL